MDCLNNEYEMDADCQIDSDLEPEAEIDSELSFVTEVSRNYTGVDTDDIKMDVDNENYTISATLQEDFIERVDALEENVGNIEGDVETISQEIDTINTDINNIETDISTINGNITTLSNGLNEAEQNIQELQNDVDNLETSKQDTLVSGENIKTINNQSILGSGNIELSVASKFVINTEGNFGTLSDADFALLIDDSKNVVIRNGVEEYGLRAIETTYRTYMAENTPDDTTVNKYAIWVQTSPQAVNYKHWSKEEVDPFGGIEDKLNQQVAVKQTGNSFSYDGDSVTFNQKFRNLKTGTEETTTENISLADSTTAGLMSPSDVQSLSTLRTEVDQLKNRNIRLLFTAKDDPTAIEINAFVLSKGYVVSDFPSISVVVRGTNHVWRYTENPSQWLDYGIDTVNQFTNTIAGIIKGSETAGKVYAENDGTGSVVGWDALTTLVNSKASQSDLSSLGDRVTQNETDIQSIEDTQSSYGNIVTHNTSEFVTPNDLLAYAKKPTVYWLV